MVIGGQLRQIFCRFFSRRQPRRRDGVLSSDKTTIGTERIAVELARLHQVGRHRGNIADEFPPPYDFLLVQVDGVRRLRGHLAVVEVIFLS